MKAVPFLSTDTLKKLYDWKTNKHGKIIKAIFMILQYLSITSGGTMQMEKILLEYFCVT